MAKTPKATPSKSPTDNRQRLLSPQDFLNIALEFIPTRRRLDHQINYPIYPKTKRLLESLSSSRFYHYHTSMDTYKARKRAYLEFSAQSEPGGGRTGFLSQLCRLELGQTNIAEDSIRTALEIVNERRDCSDFALVGLLRLCYQYQSLIAPELLQDIHATLINFKYWIDEPGYDLMFYWTENHQILFHSGEYLAGQLFPDTVFPNANLTGQQHMERARIRILHWITLRAHIGFSEWDSNCYYDEHIAPLINLADFANDPEIAEHATKLLNVLFFDIAVDSFQGNYATSHGRTYPRHVLRTDALCTTQKIAWNHGEFTSANSMTAVCLSTSRQYEVPKIIREIAQDQTQEVINLERQSFDPTHNNTFDIDPSHPQKAMPMWAAGMFGDQRTATQTLQLADTFQSGCFELIIRPYIDAVLKTYDALDSTNTQHDGDIDRRTLSEVNKITYRTPNYQLSCAQDYRKGKLGFQQHIWQATLDDNTAIFTLHRGSEDNKSLKYWQGRLPRAVQIKNLVIAIYNIPEQPDPGPPTEIPSHAEGNASPSPAPSEEILLPYTVATFPRTKFDEVIETNGWIFGRKNEGYIALCSQHPTEWTSDGIFDTEGLIANGRQNIWICQLGRLEVDGDFNTWCDTISTADLTFGELELTCQTPHLGQIHFNWTDALTVNGKEHNICNYPRFDNPYCHSEYNSGIYNIRFNNQHLNLDFTTNT